MIVTLSGSNDYLISKELYKLLSDFSASHGAMAVEKLFADEVDYQKIYDALTSLPFLSAKKMVVIYEPSKNKQFVEKAEYLLTNIAESTDVIFIEVKIDKRSSLYSILKKQTDYHEFNQLDENGLVNWLVGLAKTQRATISPSDARFLVERLGTNQQMLFSELTKVALYNKDITRKTIELNTEAIPQSSIFNLLDSMFSGDGKRALALYKEQRALQVDPQIIISMIVWQFQTISLIKAGRNFSSEQIAKDAKIKPYTVSRTTSIASKITLTELRRMIHDLLDLDIKLKSKKIDPDEALELYILRLSLE